MTTFEGYPKGMFPLDLTYEANEYDTFAELKAEAEQASNSLNLPLSWIFDDPKWCEDGEEPAFTLVFLMPRKDGNTWGMSTTNFDRAEVQAWLDTWLRGEINTWFGWSQ